MAVSGTIYGVVLNDRAERAALTDAFAQLPYNAPPDAPVVYIRPRGCLTDGPVRVPQDQSVRAAPTLALLFARDASRVSAAQAMQHVGATALALDLSLPQKDYYRPAIAQMGADGFLPIGPWIAPHIPPVLSLDPGYSWSLERLVRPVPDLIADLSAFMTLRAGDMLLIGLPGDAPVVTAGTALTVRADGYPDLPIALTEGQP